MPLPARIIGLLFSGALAGRDANLGTSWSLDEALALRLFGASYECHRLYPLLLDIEQHEAPSHHANQAAFVRTARAVDDGKGCGAWTDAEVVQDVGPSVDLDDESGFPSPEPSPLLDAPLDDQDGFRKFL